MTDHNNNFFAQAQEPPSWDPECKHNIEDGELSKWNVINIYFSVSSFVDPFFRQLFVIVNIYTKININALIVML